MKKILTHLTGIVFLITILTAGACNRGKKADDSKSEENGSREKVEITCKAVKTNGGLQFEIRDSNNEDLVVVAKFTKGDNKKFVADLETEVDPKTNVFWKWDAESDVDEFVKISPRHPNGKIMPRNAEKVPGSNQLKIKVPENGTVPGDKEAYDIIFLDWNKDTVTIDPYLKIPPQR